MPKKEDTLKGGAEICYPPITDKCMGCVVAGILKLFLNDSRRHFH